MSLFDDAFAGDTAAAEAIMGDPITIARGEKPPVQAKAVVTELEFSSALSQMLGGRHEEPAFSVFFTPTEAARVGLKTGEKGMIIAAGGLRGRVRKTTGLGGAGLQCDCGPINSK